MKIFILSNEDLTSNVIFSEIIGLEGIDVVGVGFTSTLTKNRKGVLGAFSLLRRMALRYWLYLVFVNGFYKLRRPLSIFALNSGEMQAKGHSRASERQLQQSVFFRYSAKV
jgi:hypothetical protein